MFELALDDFAGGYRYSMFAMSGRIAAAASLPSAATSDEGDHGWMRQVEGACKSRDFDSFFEGFVRSPEVRLRYGAPVIDVRLIANPTSPDHRTSAKPDDFDTALVDYPYAERGSGRRWEKDDSKPFTALQISMHAPRGGGWRVDYQPAILDYGGEDLRRTFGKRLAYVFARYRGCWRLERHLR